MIEKPRVAIICGPTGVGKTGISIDIAAQLKAEIVSADSMQVYRYMDIGTAKPTAAEMARIPHHMVNIVDPDADFDAQQYAAMSHDIIDKLAAEGKPALVVGGTGLYIRALIHGLFDSAPVNPKSRNRLKQEMITDGMDVLYKRLQFCDPKSAARIHPHDTYRIIRALEVYEITGSPISSFHQSHHFGDSFFHVMKIGLYRDRKILYERIDHRVDQMMAEGLVDEVAFLFSRGYSSGLKSMKSIGYRHTADYMEGRLSWDAAVQSMKQDTRRYAKRQFTWFKSDPQLQWIDMDHPDEIYCQIKKFLSH
jgi:tRNA dimethylallyltransferase